VLAVVVIHVPSEFFWVLLGRVGGLLSLFGLVVFPCHRRPPFYDLGCVSASNRRRCPCYAVGFRLPLDLCLCCCLFLGEDVWRRSDAVMVVVMRGGDVVVVEVIQLWWWW